VLHDRFSRRGLEIIALSIDTDEHTVAEFLTATPLPFRVALDLDQSVARRYGVSTVPATFFLDRKGHVVERVDGAVDWTREDVLASVEQLVGESS
jgi:peroxiredoxin